MSMTIHLSEDAERMFRQTWSDLDRATLEALVIQGYRQRKFGISTVRRLLEFETREQAEQWLGQQGVNWNYSIEDLDADLATAARVIGLAKR
jgi:hypothetical protein